METVDKVSIDEMPVCCVPETLILSHHKCPSYMNSLIEVWHPKCKACQFWFI